MFQIAVEKTAIDRLVKESRLVVSDLKYHPFIILATGTETQRDVIVCPTQNEIGAFADRLGNSVKQTPATFLQAFFSALQHEDYGYEAGFLFHRWITEPQPAYQVNAIIAAQPAPFPQYVGYPIIEVLPASGEAETAEKRALLLRSMFDAYITTEGNDLFRWIIADSMAIGLAKYYASTDQDDVAHSVVRKAMETSPAPIHLKAINFALTQKIAGLKIPERLEKFVGEDNGALKQRICPEPFRRFDIGPSGDVLVCCGHWLPKPLGNVLTQSVNDVLNSPRALKIRESMTDGSFRYCNHLDCAAMIQDYLPDQASVTDPKMRAAIDQKKFSVDHVEQMMFAFDQSCNLSCPSCRVARIIEKPSENTAKEAAVETKLLPLLKSLKRLDINPAGEIFSSKPSRKILEMINRQDCPDLFVDIISNGTLFTESEWNKLPNIHDMIRSVRVSVDGATKPTFEKLRRLGVFEIFVKNMTFLGELRRRGTIPQFKFSFTYQIDNFREMEDFVHFARGFACDFVIFERLQNLGTFTPAEFQEKAVHLSHHPLHHEFLEMIRKPIFAERHVWHDFEWDGAAAISPLEARDRLQNLEASYSRNSNRTPDHLPMTP